MISKNITVNMKQESGATPIAVLVQIASSFESKIYIEEGDKKINAKSIMGMMALGLVQGGNLSVNAEGADEEAALAAMENFLTGADEK